MALLGSAIVFILFDRAPGTLEDFYAWHDREHMPERLGIPGFFRGRRYHVVGAGPQFLTLYEALDIDVLVGSEYMQRLNNPTILSRKIGPLARNNSRGVCRILKSIARNPSGSTIALLRFSCTDPSNLDECLNSLEPSFRTTNGLYGVHWCDTNKLASTIEVEEKKNREICIPESIILVEGNQVKTVLSTANEIVRACKSISDQLIHDTQISTYSLEVTHLPK